MKKPRTEPSHPGQRPGLLRALFGSADRPDEVSPASVDGPFSHRLWEAWMEATRRVGVRSIRKRDAGSRHLRFIGQLARLRVTLESPPTRLQPGLHIVIRDRGQGSGELTVERQEKVFEPGSRLGRRELEVGDPAFDAAFSVQGDPLLAQAGLDAPTRAKLAALLSGEVKGRGGRVIPVEASFERGELKVFVEPSREETSEEVADGLTDLLEVSLGVARHLAKPKDLASRLANALGSGGSAADPEVGVRLRSLRLLLREFPHHEAAKRALRVARRDPSEEVRLEGAIGQGERGRGTILELMGNPRISDSCAARAVVALGESLPHERAASLLAQALAAGRHELARACLEAPSLAPRTEYETLRLEALASMNTEVVKVAALALGETGTAAAVPTLREVGQRGDRETARVCRQAIAEIQARLKGAGAGQLSLAGSEAGTLSLGEEREAGRVSLVDKKLSEGV